MNEDLTGEDSYCDRGAGELAHSSYFWQSYVSKRYLIPNIGVLKCL